MVTYGVAWIFLSSGCSGFEPVLDLSCGSEGRLRLLFATDLENNNAVCNTVSSTNVTCTSDYDTNPDADAAVSVAIGFDCVGKNDTALQGIAQSHAQTAVTCDGSFNLATHQVVLAYDRDDTDDLLFDRTCEEGDADDSTGACSATDTCSGSGCALPLGDVRAAQNVPITANAIFPDNSAAMNLGGSHFLTVVASMVAAVTMTMGSWW